jgi:hypothetical protein
MGTYTPSQSLPDCDMTGANLPQALDYVGVIYFVFFHLFASP